MPVEPTGAMVKAGVDYRLSTCISGANRWHDDTAILYAAMRDAVRSEG